jgi:hypothetical protein
MSTRTAYFASAHALSSGLTRSNVAAALDAEPVRPLEVDEQQADVALAQDVAHRVEHAVAVEAGERQRLVVDHLHEPRRAALVGDRRPPLRVDGGQEEHVARGDEGLLVGGKGAVRPPGVEHVGELARAERLLQCDVLVEIEPFHPSLLPKPPTANMLARPTGRRRGRSAA